VATAAQIGAALRGQVAKVAIDIVLTLDKKLRRTTPVDTGHARRNWISSVTQPHTGEVDDDAAHAAGIAAVLRYTLELGPLWVANNAPYVNRLNHGWSKQRPAGFVERAMDETLQEVGARWGRKGIDVSEMRTAFQSAAGAPGAENLASAYSPFGDDW
jgi:hypothetical protein